MTTPSPRPEDLAREMIGFIEKRTPGQDLDMLEIILINKFAEYGESQFRQGKAHMASRVAAQFEKLCLKENVEL